MFFSASAINREALHLIFKVRDTDAEARSTQTIVVTVYDYHIIRTLLCPLVMRHTCGVYCDRLFIPSVSFFMLFLRKVRKINKNGQHPLSLFVFCLKGLP
jgi:hypothetical protein